MRGLDSKDWVAFAVKSMEQVARFQDVHRSFVRCQLLLQILDDQMNISDFKAGLTQESRERLEAMLTPDELNQLHPTVNVDVRIASRLFQVYYLSKNLMDRLLGVGNSAMDAANSFKGLKESLEILDKLMEGVDDADPKPDAEPKAS